MIRVVLASCVLVGVADAQPAPEAPPAPEAKPLDKLDTSKLEALYASGTKHYNLGEWDAAIADFKQLYALMPDPTFLFNLGQAYRQKGSCREATAVYKSYLRTASDADRGRVEPLVAELEPCVRAEEEKARRLLPPAPPPRLSDRHRLIRRVGYGVLGAGAIGFGAASYFTYRSTKLEDQRNACTDISPCSASKAISLEHRGEQANRRAGWSALIGGTLAVIGGGAVIYTMVRGEYVTVEPARGGAMVSTEVKF